MDTSALPRFKYHPDPVATGSVQPDDKPCVVCGQARGFLYQGPVGAVAELEGSVCPWCIADGSAARRFDVEFNDAGTMEDVPDSVRDEVAQRTPGFTGWQQERWLCCCGDAAEFLGPAGEEELRKRFPDAIDAVREAIGQDYELDGDDLDEFFSALSRDDQPTAYLFRCLHCRRHLAYVDEA